MATDGQDGTPKPWQALYSAALQELSVEELPERIRSAEKEIAIELGALTQVSNQPPATLGRLECVA